MALRSALHFVGDRSKTVTFYSDVLAMTILRHKELEEGCNKPMVGLGPEYDDLVAELIYNYRVGEYRLGNDFLSLTLQSSQAVSNAKLLGWPLTGVGKGLYMAEAPGGYRLYLVDKEQPPTDPVQKVCLAGSDLQESIHGCSSLLGTKVKEGNKEKKTVLMGFTETQCKLELHNIFGTVDHVPAFGQIAFSCPREQLADLEALMTKGNRKILTPLVSLDAPGKACLDSPGKPGLPWEGLVSLDSPGKAWLAWTPLGRLG
uniref:Glyoxalase domain-containing protein n=1 Tax=Oncorhynchus mykiss TaxID=8022 RepID=A0A8K9UJR8_ONCMY